MCFPPLVRRLLELANDVELNPGPLPHKLVRPQQTMGGLNKKQPVKFRDPDMKETSSGQLASSVEDLRLVIDKQNEQILRQNDEIKSLKKKIDENDKVVSDFKSELSEVRKKWQSMGDLRTQTHTR